MKSVSILALASALALCAAATPPALAQAYPGGQNDYQGGPPPGQGSYQGPPPQGGGMPQEEGPEGYGPGPGGANMRNVTLQQFQARQVAHVMRMDAHHSGRVSLADWTAWHEAHPGRGGQVDPTRAFERLDLNHDGYITPDEVSTVAARRYARMQSGGPGMGQGGMGPGGMGQGGMGQGGMGPGGMGPGEMGPGAMGPGAMGPGAMGPGGGNPPPQSLGPQ